ncbi:hypothetical protein [Archangium sp.]|uniref:hypothetical protein n=1 Tax=Archangium sp. TaxID=1872627 RepID=UPI002D23493D|nr:hypothetical protein [Archangium sp.]HYO58315.1 hypothetical protein [Archangium sp.]
MHAHLTRQPWGSWPGRPLARWPWLLAGAAVAVAAGLVLLAPWPRSPKSTAEHEGKCYMPVRKKDPEPRSLQP